MCGKVVTGCAQRGEAVRHKQVLVERPVLMRRLVPHYVPLPALSSESGPALPCRLSRRHLPKHQIILFQKGDTQHEGSGSVLCHRRRT